MGFISNKGGHSTFHVVSGVDPAVAGLPLTQAALQSTGPNPLIHKVFPDSHCVEVPPTQLPFEVGQPSLSNPQV